MQVNCLNDWKTTAPASRPQLLTQKETLTNSGIDVVVVPHERIKGAELHPPKTKLLIRVTDKSADVGTDKRNSIELEFQNSCKHKFIGLLWLNAIKCNILVVFCNKIMWWMKHYNYGKPFLSRVSILLLTRDIDIVILSVCLSVTRWYCMKTA